MALSRLRFSMCSLLAGVLPVFSVLDQTSYMSSLSRCFGLVAVMGEKDLVSFFHQACFSHDVDYVLILFELFYDLS